MIRAFRQLGHVVREVALVSVEGVPQDPEKDAAVAGWKVILRRIPGAFDLTQLGYNLAGFPMMAVALAGGRVGLIYERYSLHSFAGVLAARLFRVPLVLEVNSPFAIEHQRDGDILGFRFALWTERTICNLATRVVAVSGPLRSILISQGVEPGKILVVPNGVNTPAFFGDGSAAAIRDRLGMTGRVVIGFVGWFRQWHRLDVLLDAFQERDLAGRGAALLLVGDGPETPRLRDFVEKHGLQDAVVFVGPQPHEAVPGHLAAFDIAVQPAANEYCCPMKILEYMALGKPVVAPRQPNIEELVEDGEEALLFQPNDKASLGQALLDLIEHPEQRRRLGQAGFNSIRKRNLTWIENARRVMESVRG